MFWNQINDYCFNVNPYDNMGNFFEIWDKEFGMKSLEAMNKKIEDQKNMDLRFLRFVYEHYSCMSMKIDFLKNYEGYNIASELINDYRSITSKALVNLNVGLKHNLLADGVKRINLRLKM